MPNTFPSWECIRRNKRKLRNRGAHNLARIKTIIALLRLLESEHDFAPDGELKRLVDEIAERIKAYEQRFKKIY
jgi:hypothetical protein